MTSGDITLSERACHRCTRPLRRWKASDGLEMYQACTTLTCARRRATAMTRVGCWRTPWKHPEELAAVQRTHDRQCTNRLCVSRRLRRQIAMGVNEFDQLPQVIDEGFALIDPRDANDLGWTRRTLIMMGATIDDESPLTAVFTPKREARP